MNTSYSYRAFTLIEVLIYLGLFTILLLGALSGIFAITAHSERNRMEAELEQEGNFILAKISWLIDTSVTEPSVTAKGIRTESAEGTVSIEASEDGIVLIRGSDDPAQLTRPNITIEHSVVSRTENPTAITFTATLTSKDSRGNPYHEIFSRMWYIHPYP